MKAHGWGRIINIGGASSRRSGNWGWTKGATQASLINLTKRLSDVLGPLGITVNLVEPGGVWTDGKAVGGQSRADVREDELRDAAERDGVSRDEMERRALSEIPIRRFLSAEDAAHVVLFLVSSL